MFETHIQVTGLNTLKKNVLDTIEWIEDDSPRKKKIAVGAGDIIADAIRSKAPRGKTGNLARSIVSKPFASSSPSDSFVAIDYRIAPHAHLVEFGTSQRFLNKKNVMYSEDTGKFFGKSVAAMPAIPFFRPGFNVSKDGAVTYIKNQLDRGLNKSWR